MFCIHCGNKHEDTEVTCGNCGKGISKKEVPDRHIVLAVLFPIIGIILGIIFAVQDKKGSLGLLVVSFLAQIMWFLLWLLLMASGISIITHPFFD